MGAYKKLSMELDRKHQVRLVAALEDFVGSTMAPCGCNDINNMCPKCEASYLQWMENCFIHFQCVADLKEEYEDDLNMLGG